MNRTDAVSFVSGLVFALGLGLGGMANANKVVNFLDLVGAWDPSLAFVMGGAIAVHLVAYQWFVPRMQQPLFAPRFGIPTRSDIDGRLVGGAALFGLGWGLGGYCPGPGIVSLGSGSMAPAVFMVAMVGGMLVFHELERRQERARVREDNEASAVS